MLDIYAKMISPQMILAGLLFKILIVETWNIPLLFSIFKIFKIFIQIHLSYL